MPIHFYVDPATNYSDPDARMAYGLHVVSPWGGTVFINLPEHLEYMPGTRGIARHHDERDIVWQIEGGESLPTMRPRASVNPGSSFAPS